jgi:SAM-dependent methyltransferase
MTLSAEELDRIAARTLAHYNEHAREFREGTRDHDVSQNIAALLQYIEAAPPFAILDFGCGPGRDLKTFRQIGHAATGLEGAAQLAAMARACSGCEVLEQSFLALDLPQRHLNTHYWFDPARDVAGVIMTQTLPFAQPRFMAVYGQFERGA